MSEGCSPVLVHP